MYVQVSLDELIATPVFAFDVLTGSGEVVFQAGQALAKQEVLRAARMPLYRNNQALPFLHEGNVIYLSRPRATEALQEDADTGLNSSSEDLADSMAHFQQSTDPCVKALEAFWQQLKSGTAPDVALLEIAGDRLVAEIIPRVDQMMYMSQMRLRDGVTYHHTLEVAAVSAALAAFTGMDRRSIQEVTQAALLHDLGKLLIPKSIMFKAGRLTDQEFDVMKLHPELGYRIIKQELKLPAALALPALEHQEMNGGGGYPHNKKGDDIHPYSQIVKIADVYDALTSRRPYKDPIPSQKAIQIMRSEGSKSFNPQLLEQFMSMAHYQPDPAEGSTTPA
ncbi:MAG: HD domain-containing protein [Candidatus Melainabacteria bacterium]|nr:HD domain-containing protein [Candidatus Melainabacteria bacterium]